MADDKKPTIEFDFSKGAKFDGKFWRFESGFVRGKERGYYIPGIGQTVSVSDGLLTIQASRYDPSKSHLDVDASAQDPNGGAVQYVSGSIFTDQAWRCARFEVVAKMPGGRGTFPAIWLRGIRQDTYGEIDIAEYVGRKPNDLGSTIYFGANSSDLKSVTKHIACDECTSGFRTYTADLDGRKAVISIDGEQIVQQEYGNLTDTEKAPLAQPYRLKLNLALGGPNAGPIDDAALPALMQIRSIRIWEKACPLP